MYRVGKFKNSKVFVKVGSNGMPETDSTGKWSYKYKDEPNAQHYFGLPSNMSLNSSGSKSAGDSKSSSSALPAASSNNPSSDTKALLDSFASNAIVAYTDGACQGNPGPCGAGVVVYLPRSASPIEKHAALGQGTNNIAELTAISLVFDTLLEYEMGRFFRTEDDNPTPPARKRQKIETPTCKCLGCGCNIPAVCGPCSKPAAAVPDTKDSSASSSSSSLPSTDWALPAGAAIEILTDSRYAQGVLTLGWKAKVNVELIASIKAKIAARAKTHPIRIHWVKGHAGIPGNERADRLANQGVQASQLASTKGSSGSGHKRKATVDVFSDRR